MKIRFVNHACFILEHEDVTIINDPWLEGRVFNNGWDFISPTRLRYEEFETIINTNDCGIRNKDGIDYIKSLVGNVDILLTQFSYAYWAGNRDEVAYRKKIADEKLLWVKFQTDNFKPKVTIPIASYIYFCHE